MNAILGSSNLTGGGLNGNYETNLLIDGDAVVRQLLEYIEEHLEGAYAKELDRDWLSEYERLWTERKQAEQRQRKLRERTRRLGKPPANVPDKIKGSTFAFTGKIDGWSRDKLYPYVLRHGGHLARKAESMAKANCLVQGEILGGRESTKKLAKAHERHIPIITEEEFRKLAGIRA
jgi:NAD-dependent DNA ligase